MATASFSEKGMQAARDALAGLGPKVTTIGAGALYKEGIDIMNASLDIVPVLTGRLKGTGTVFPPVEVGGDAVVLLSYGDAEIDYAVEQHETPPEIYSHRAGQSWKYLERPAFEATRGMGHRIALYINNRLKREA